MINICELPDGHKAFWKLNISAQTISGTQHEGACSRGGSGGGVRGGVYPPLARLLCPSIRLYLGPSIRGRARGAVSKHQTISGTQHEGACSRGGSGGGSGGVFTPPRHGCCVKFTLNIAAGL